MPSPVVPLELTLELSRAVQPSSPYAFRFERQDYHRRHEDGTSDSAPFPWEQAVVDDLAALQETPPDPDAKRRFGTLLHAFVTPLGWAADEAHIREALAQKRAVHLTIRSTAAEIHALPWELLTLGNAGPAVGDLPGVLVRYEWPGFPTAAPTPDPPPEGGRILFAWSGEVPARDHLDALRQACAAGYVPFHEERDVVEDVSRRRLREALAAGPPVGVLHLLCHGAALRSRALGYGLRWTGDDGEEELVGGDDLGRDLHPYLGSLRLVVLCACFSGGSRQLGSVAQALHRQGIPAVVASRYPLSTDGSVVLTKALYTTLLGAPASLEEAFLEGHSALDSARTMGDRSSLQLYARRDDGPDHRPVVFAPYRGLRPFEQAHERFFFGRQEELREILAELEQLIREGKPRFQVVEGASGTGKSSLVLAKVVPALLKQGWRWARMVPGTHPQAALDAALQSLPPGGATQRTLLVVDQFEEVFTQVSQQEERDALVQSLWRDASDPDGRVSVICTLRSDFRVRCQELSLEPDRKLRMDRLFTSDRAAHNVFIPQMTPEQMKEAIEKPAQRVGLELAEGLPETMLAEVSQEPGALPLVQLTLELLWEKREGRVLTPKSYEKLGRILGALQKHADQVMDALRGEDPEHERVARWLLLGLVHVTRGDGPDTRRRARLAALRPSDPADAGRFERVLQVLVDKRLLVSSGVGSEQTIEVAHEALLRKWERLGTWIKEERGKLLALDELHGRVATRKKGEFLTRGQLEEAEALVKGAPGLVKGEALEWVVESRAAIDKEEKRRRAALWWSRALALGAVVVAVILGVLGVVAVRASRMADEQRDSAQKALGEAQRQRDAARTASRMASAREVLALGRGGPALLVLAAVQGRENVRGWAELATDTLAYGFPRSTLRHEGDVWSAAWSPDGKRIVTASEDETARVWNADGQGDPIVLKGHKGWVRSAAWSPDGKRIVTASWDRTARVWNADGQGAPIVLKGHEGEVRSAAWSPDGKRIVTASHDNTARVWNANGQGDPIVLKGHGSGVDSAAWSPDGKRIVTASYDKTARVWYADGQSDPIVLKGHEGVVRSAAWSPDGKRIVTASDDKTARVWNADGQGDPIVLKGHEGVVRSAAWSPDGKRVVTASDDKTARVWNADGQGAPIVLLKGHDDGVCSAAWSPDGKRIVTTSWDRTARVWNADGQGDPIVLKGHKIRVHLAAWSPDGKRIVTASHDNTARVWNADGQGDPIVLKGHEGDVWSAAWSPDGKRIVTASRDKTARVWNADGQGDPVVLKGHGSGVESAAWSPDGKRIVTASRDKTARVWNADGQGVPIVLKGHEGEVRSAAWSPDGKRIVTASYDGTARVWNSDGQGVPIVLKGQVGEVRSAAWSPDGKRIVTAAMDDTARVWNSDGQGVPIVLKGHEGWVRSAAWSPDGKRIVTASYDKTARVWNSDGQGVPIVLKGHRSGVRSAAWSPDGKRIVTASTDNTARVWDADGQGDPIVLKGHETAVPSAAWSPDGERIVTASMDNAARVWNADGRGDSIILKGYETLAPSAAWDRDGKRIVTASRDHSARIWLLDIPALQQLLRDATTDCLTTDERKTYLAEDDAEARAGYEACERGHHRTPAPDPQEAR